MKKGYKEYYVASIFLLVIFAVLLFSCEKNMTGAEYHAQCIYEGV